MKSNRVRTNKEIINSFPEETQYIVCHDNMIAICCDLVIIILPLLTILIYIFSAIPGR